jgi:hypothetical protein
MLNEYFGRGEGDSEGRGKGRGRVGRRAGKEGIIGKAWEKLGKVLMANCYINFLNGIKIGM